MYLILKGKNQPFWRQLDLPELAGSGPIQTRKSEIEINLLAAKLFK